MPDLQIICNPARSHDMHGFIFFKFKKFIDEKFENGIWIQVLNESGVGYKNYWPANMYPDEEMFALVNTVPEITDLGRDELLKDFGIFLGPGLMDMYTNLINPEWDTLDLIENTESRMHTVVRSKNVHARPPQLDIDRVSSNRVMIDYYSDRKFCALLKGIAKGIAQHYNDNIEITEASCMHNGEPKCTISIQLVNSPPLNLQSSVSP